MQYLYKVLAKKYDLKKSNYEDLTKVGAINMIIDYDGSLNKLYYELDYVLVGVDKKDIVIYLPNHKHIKPLVFKPTKHIKEYPDFVSHEYNTNIVNSPANVFYTIEQASLTPENYASLDDVLQLLEITEEYTSKKAEEHISKRTLQKKN